MNLDINVQEFSLLKSDGRLQDVTIQKTLFIVVTPMIILNLN